MTLEQLEGYRQDLENIIDTLEGRNECGDIQTYILQQIGPLKKSKYFFDSLVRDVRTMSLEVLVQPAQQEADND